MTVLSYTHKIEVYCSHEIPKLWQCLISGFEQDLREMFTQLTRKFIDRCNLMFDHVVSTRKCPRTSDLRNRKFDIWLFDWGNES